MRTTLAILMMCSLAVGQHMVSQNQTFQVNYADGSSYLSNTSVYGQEGGGQFSGVVQALGVAIPLPPRRPRWSSAGLPGRFYYWEVSDGHVHCNVTVFLGHPLNPVYTEVTFTDLRDIDNPGHGGGPL